MNRFDRLFEHDKNRAPERASAASRTPVSGLPEGGWIDDGVYRIDSLYEIGSPHGDKTLDLPESAQAMRHFGAAGQIIFLDLETTGLSGGTGTYAFLCGLGFSEGDRFNVVQLFLEGPARERAWLAAIDGLIPTDATLVTYNGKTFDIPLLSTRQIMARREPHWRGLPHIDLLHFSRRLYRGYLQSCSLGSIEKNVLGLRRSGVDIPGALIPGMYLQYLRSKDASPLEGVFYHNRLDIVSLSALYSHIDNVLEGDSRDGREILRAGDIWYSQGLHDRAREFWDAACEKELSMMDARLRRAYHAKRSSDYSGAREDFLFVMRTLEGGGRCGYESVSYFSVCEELAKLEEHRFKSPDRAIYFAEKALAWLKKNRYLFGGAYGKMLKEMGRRLERLEKKNEDR